MMPASTVLAGLLAKWRAEAEMLGSADALCPGGKLTLRHVAELEAACAADADELLTLEAAAIASGFAVDTLRKMVAQGRIPNAGKKHRPRLRRADLPAKPRVELPGAPRDVGPSPASGYDPDADALALFRKRRAS